MSLEMKVPAVGESISEVILSQWLKQDGDYVEMDEVVAELESDKATFELPAEKAGTLKIVAQEGDTLAIGAVVCIIEEGDAPAKGKKESEPSAKEAATEQKTTEKETVSKEEATEKEVEAKSSYASGTPSPAAAKILDEKGVNAKDIQGTGKDGRITKGDAQKAEMETENAAELTESTSMAQAKPAGGTRQERRERISSLRKTIAKRLVTVKNDTAMLTTFNEVDMKPIMDIRTKYKEKFKEKHAVGLGFMSFFAKAVCQALQEWPAVNARIEENEFVYSDFVDISIAVSAPKGLVVPIIRNAESLSLQQIEKAVVDLATKARNNKLTIEEMTGGTFTITNGGVFGSMMSTPIINAPQSAILGMHNIIERPVVVNGEIVVRPMMYLALSYDHRIIDGRESVGFLVRVKQLLEDPTRLILEV